ncbi:MAG: hypothetical protein JNK12_14225 [Acidimicrobiales bacterium]|nr:hypothetical protein [Acidimicrobiales bacterium]
MGTRTRLAAAACLLATVAAGLVSCSSDDPDEGGAAATGAPGETATLTSAGTPPPNVPLLGVVNGSGGTFEDDTLTLTGVQPSGIWFTDRPHREAGTSAMEDFLPLFFDRDDPPNAALEIADADEDGDLAIVELTDPVWDDSTDELTFTATVIPEVEPERLADHAGLGTYLARNDGEVPATFDAAALFIDSGKSHPVTPVAVQPTGAEVAQLESSYQSTVTGLENLMDQIRSAFDSDPQATCLQAMMGDASQAYQQAVTVMAPKVRAMQADLAAGTDDPTGYQAALSLQQNLESGRDELASVFADYQQRGRCATT